MGKKKPEIAENIEGVKDAAKDLPQEFIDDFAGGQVLVEKVKWPEPAKEPEQDIITALQADNLRISGELQVAKERIDKLALVVLQNWGKVI